MREEWWIFTFGVGHEHGGHYVKIKGTFDEAREKMFDKYGKGWCGQYSESEWAKYEEQEKQGKLRFPLETLLEIIE